MFRGSHKYSVDAKGRVSIPARFRKLLTLEANDTFIMTKGTVKCIDVYPLDEWLKIEERLNKLNLFDPKNAKFTRMTLIDVIDCKLDTQARILIPQSLLEYAQIGKEILILGMLKKIELWNPEIYDEYTKPDIPNYGELAEKVMAT